MIAQVKSKKQEKKSLRQSVREANLVVAKVVDVLVAYAFEYSATL